LGDFLHPHDRERVRRAWASAMRASREYADTCQLRRFDGEFRWHAIRVVPQHDNDGLVTRWVGSAVDTEEHRRLELALHDTEHQALETLTLLQSIEAAAPVGFKLVDHDLRVVRINERLASVTGHTTNEVVGRRVEDVAPALWPQLEGVYRRALAGEAVSNVEVTTPNLDDPQRDRHWLANYYPVYVGGEIIGVGNVVIEVTELKDAQDAISHNLAAMVQTIATTVEYRDPYTAGHQRRVADLAAAIGTELALDACEVEGIRTAASIHDLGKISIPAEILSKPGTLSYQEHELVKQHAEAGYNIVACIDFPWPVAEMIRQHHERLDGSGYPRGLHGDEILLGARIIAVADVVEAMTAHRPYRPGYGVGIALTQIERDRGTLLDSDVVHACAQLFHSGRLRV